MQIDAQREALGVLIDWTRRPSLKGKLIWDEEMKEMARKKDDFEI